MAFRKFEEIEAWKLGRKLVKAIYELTGVEAFARDYGLRDQIRRAAVSICSNIAEGFGRRGNREFVNFLWIAKGSVSEVQSQLYHAYDLKYIKRDDCRHLYNEANIIAVKLYHLIQSLSDSSLNGLSYKRISPPSPLRTERSTACPA